MIPVIRFEARRRLGLIIFFFFFISLNLVVFFFFLTVIRDAVKCTDKFYFYGNACSVDLEEICSVVCFSSLLLIYFGKTTG